MKLVKFNIFKYLKYVHTPYTIHLVNMNDDERLNLRKMIAANDTDDNTDNIRRLKNSELIRADVAQYLKLKHDYARLAKSNPSQYDAICVSRCSFLFNNYTDILNKLKKDEIDLKILMNLVSVLKMIEDGQLDQHEGSFEVGKLLKQIYVDSALRKSEHLDEQHTASEKRKAAHTQAAVKNISWKQYKDIKNAGGGGGGGGGGGVA